MSVLDNQEAARLGRHSDDRSKTLSRSVHLVGSLPSEVCETDLAAMQWILDQVDGADLTTLPCDRDPRWIINYLESLRDRAVFDLVVDGDSRNYRRLPVHRVRRHEQLAAADLMLGRTSEVTAAMAMRRQLDLETLPPHQVSIPDPLDLALFAFGVPAATMRLLAPKAALRAMTSAVRYLSLFTVAVIEEIRHIQQRWGPEVVFQLESPATVVMYEKMPRSLWSVVTGWMARHVARIIEASPPHTKFVLHRWCYGDLGHKPISELRDLDPFVRCTNALAGELDRPLPPVHVALCDGLSPPSSEPVAYAPLADLRPDVRLIAGLVDEDHPEASSTALRHVEAVLGRTVFALSAACGHGRRTPAAAAANIALAVELCAQGV